MSASTGSTAAVSSAVVIGRLRRFLLFVVLFLCIGTIVELLLQKHTKEPQQFIPFVLCAAGAVAVLAVLIRPHRNTILALRGMMVLVAAGSLLGVYFHFSNNYELESEMRPNAPITEVLLPTLQGASPMMAPGILALAGVLSIAATYYHPALTDKPTE